MLAESWSPSAAADAIALAELHRGRARRLLEEGSPTRAWAELVRAARAGPLSPRLAAALVWLSLRAGTEASAVALLRDGMKDHDGWTRARIRFQLVRLLRRRGELEAARAQLVEHLAETPTDARARRVLNALLQRLSRWQELDASLAVSVQQASLWARTDLVVRGLLQRARLSMEGLSDHGRAAQRYREAVAALEAVSAFDRAFDLRLLFVRALHRSKAGPTSLDQAVADLRAAAKRVGRKDRAEALVADLGLEGPQVGRRRTETELLAAGAEAEQRGRHDDAAALLSAAVAEENAAPAVQQLEAHFIRRRAWRELSELYRTQSAKSSQPKERALWLARLAELLEDELSDIPAAAKVWGELVALGGEPRALKEQVRLLRLF